jgi:hypothetical protein
VFPKVLTLSSEVSECKPLNRGAGPDADRARDHAGAAGVAHRHELLQGRACMGCHFAPVHVLPPSTFIVAAGSLTEEGCGGGDGWGRGTGGQGAGDRGTGARGGGARGARGAGGRGGGWRGAGGRGGGGRGCGGASIGAATQDHTPSFRAHHFVPADTHNTLSRLWTLASGQVPGAEHEQRRRHGLHRAVR